MASGEIIGAFLLLCFGAEIQLPNAHSESLSDSGDTLLILRNRTVTYQRESERRSRRSRLEVCRCFHTLKRRVLKRTQSSHSSLGTNPLKIQPSPIAETSKAATTRQSTPCFSRIPTSQCPSSHNATHACIDSTHMTPNSVSHVDGKNVISTCCPTNRPNGTHAACLKHTSLTHKALQTGDSPNLVRIKIARAGDEIASAHHLVEVFSTLQCPT